MSKSFDAKEYVSKWDKRMIPIMLALIVISLVGAYALNILTRPDCITHDYVFCGTDIVTYEAGHGGAHGAHAAPAGSETHMMPHGQDHSGHDGHDHGGHGGEGEGHAPH